MRLHDLQLDVTRLMISPSMKTKTEEKFLSELPQLIDFGVNNNGSILLILGRSGTGKTFLADNVRKSAEMGKIFGVDLYINEVVSVDLDTIGEPILVEASKKWTWSIDSCKLSDVLVRSRGEANILVLAGTSSNTSEIIDLILLEGILNKRQIFFVINSTSPEAFVEIKKRKKADMFTHHSAHKDASKDWVNKIKDVINKDAGYIHQFLLDYETEVRNKIRSAVLKVKTFNLQSDNTNAFILNNFNVVLDKKTIRKGWH